MPRPSWFNERGESPAMLVGFVVCLVGRVLTNHKGLWKVRVGNPSE